LEQRPEQPGEPHRAKIFEREAIEEGLIRQVEEIAGAGAPRIVDENVAAPETVLDAGKHLLAAGKRTQVADDGERLWPDRGDRLGGGGEIVRRGGGEHALGSLTRKGERDATADAATPARYDDNLSLKVSRHLKASLRSGFAISYLPYA